MVQSSKSVVIITDSRSVANDQLESIFATVNTRVSPELEDIHVPPAAKVRNYCPEF